MIQEMHLGVPNHESRDIGRRTDIVAVDAADHQHASYAAYRAPIHRFDNNCLLLSSTIDNESRFHATAHST